MTTTDQAIETKGAGQYADVNGIHLYYETHGTGRPIVLLHGGLGSGEMFGPLLPALAAGHLVIVPDLQGHGRTADIDRPIDVRLMGDDIAALIGHLGLGQPDVVGLLARWRRRLLHRGPGIPRAVRKLVMVSTNIRRDAIYPDMLAQQLQVGPAAAEFMKDTPMYQGYQRVAPRPGTSRSCWARWASRWPRTSTSATRSAGSRCRRCSPAPTPTCSRRATPSRCSSCSTAVSATAAGWARAGRPGARARDRARRDPLQRLHLAGPGGRRAVIHRRAGDVVGPTLGPARVERTGGAAMEIDLNGTRLWFDIDGPALVPDGAAMRERPTVVLVHGGPGSYDHSYFKPDFGRLTRSRGSSPWTCVDTAVPGGRRSTNGRSRRAPTTSARSATRSTIARPIVFGHSMGGFVAMLYGARHPGHAGGLILQSTMARFELERLADGFRRFGGDEIAKLARRDYDGEPITDAEWDRVFATFGPRVPDPDQLARRTRNAELGRHGMDLMRRIRCHRRPPPDRLRDTRLCRRA